MRHMPGQEEHGRARQRGQRHSKDGQGLLLRNNQQESTQDADEEAGHDGEVCFVQVLLPRQRNCQKQNRRAVTELFTPQHRR